MPAPRTRQPKTKGELTREQVIVEAAALFNRLGYANASVSDIMRATGLKKGGIYRHFESKEALALVAFDFAVEQLGRRFRDALENKASAGERLRAVVAVYARLPSDPPVPGGCPVLNAAIEADDSNPALKRRVAKVMRDWHGTLTELVLQGQREAELQRRVNATQFVTTLVASLEGAIMLSKLLGTPEPMRDVVTHVEGQIRALELH